MLTSADAVILPRTAVSVSRKYDHCLVESSVSHQHTGRPMQRIIHRPEMVVAVSKKTS